MERIPPTFIRREEMQAFRVKEPSRVSTAILVDDDGGSQNPVSLRTRNVVRPELDDDLDCVLWLVQYTAQIAVVRNAMGDD